MRFNLHPLPGLLAFGLSLSPGPIAGAAQSVAATQGGAGELAVCADPYSLPYASDRQPGFENRIAAVLAADQHAALRYTWYGATRGFLRRTLLAGACDVVIGLPAALPESKIISTRPYYAASYVAVTRAGDARHFTSFDDGWLRDARIGIMLLGDDMATTPPQNALISRGITQHMTGFPMRSTHDVENPQSRIVDAVADGQVDVAFVWGPIAGYFARPHGAALRLEPVKADAKNPDLQFVYAMSVGVRKSDTALRDALQGAIDRHRTEIAGILSEYGIPTVPLTEPHVQLSANVVAQKAGPPPPTH